MASQHKLMATAVFLGDRNPPTSLVLLKRAPDKPFAPNLYTGIGGKAEPGESPAECAVREMLEETGITGVDIAEFGRVLVNGGLQVLCYFFGVWTGDLPKTPDGRLYRVPVGRVLRRNFIPTARLVVESWRGRGWSLRPFTLFVERPPRSVDDFNDQRVIAMREGIFEPRAGLALSRRRR